MILANKKELEKLSLELLTSMFFNITKEDEQYFYLISKYDFKIKYANFNFDQNELIEKNNLLLTKWTKSNILFQKDNTHSLKIAKTKEISNVKTLVKVLYEIIQFKFLEINDIEKMQEILLFSLFLFRGSFDFSAGFLSVDVPKILSFPDYYNLIFKILSNSLDNLFVLNLNFRDLQPQFVANKNKRNNQIRINLHWFYNKYIEKTQEINLFKYMILKNNENLIKSKKITQSYKFVNRLIFYIKNFEKIKSLKNEWEVLKIREELEFNKNKEEFTRSKALVIMANSILPNHCFSCKDQYNLKDRTFLKNKDIDEYYLEIHHVFPFSNSMLSEHLDNLVKLCPTCHTALSKNRARENHQKEIIKNILLNSKDAKKYILQLMNKESTEEEIINFIYENLK